MDTGGGGTFLGHKKCMENELPYCLVLGIYNKGSIMGEGVSDDWLLIWKYSWMIIYNIKAVYKVSSRLCIMHNITAVYKTIMSMLLVSS